MPVGQERDAGFVLRAERLNGRQALPGQTVPEDHTPVETALLGEVKAAFDWIDVTREFVPHDQKSYSWWSYRAIDWQASNRGRRLDHIWVSQALKGGLKSQAIISKMRGWQKASDHVPVIVEIEI